MALATKGTDWSEEEVSLCVEAYFYTFGLILSGEKVIKEQVYRELEKKIGRTTKSVGRKFRNISAVLEVLDRDWMQGLVPDRHYQKMLALKVGNHIESLDHILQLPRPTSIESNLREPPPFFMEAPPELENATQDDLPNFMKDLLSKFDPVARDARNRALGSEGEAFVVQQQKQFLKQIERQDLADNVRWVSKEEGDGAGYDILSFDDRGTPKFIEVKTTVSGKKTPFYITRNEFQFSQNSSDNYSLIRLYDFRKKVRGFEITGKLEKFVSLSTEVYRAGFSR